MGKDSSRDSKNRTREETVEMIVFIVVAIALAYGINVGIQSYSGLDTSLVVVETGSMQPTLTGIYVFDMDTRTTHLSPVSGDVLLIKKISPNDLNIGDIIVFEDPRGGEIPIVHRIVENYERNGIKYFRTSGDNPATNNQVDWWEVNQEQVIGKVISRIPRVGYLKLSLQTTIGRFFLLFIIILLVVSMFLFPDDSKNTESAEGDPTSSYSQPKADSRDERKKVDTKNLVTAIILLCVITIPILANSVAVMTQQTRGQIQSVNLRNGPLSTQTPQLSVQITLWSSGYFWDVLDSATILIDGNPEPEFMWTSPYRWRGVKEISADFFISQNITRGTSLEISLVIDMHNSWGNQWSEMVSTSLIV